MARKAAKTEKKPHVVKNTRKPRNTKKAAVSEPVETSAPTDEHGDTVYRNAAGQIHRDNDQPAVIRKQSGARSWYRNGQRHRDGGKPALIFADGMMEWWVDGVRLPSAK